MSARADIFLGGGGKRLAVPVEAVDTDEDEDGKARHRAWVERDGVARRVDVQVGLSDDHWEEITSGLKAGDRVITGPARALRGLVEGDRVRQRPADEKAKDEAKAADTEPDAE
jgi:HlyD family secretion protein